MKKRIITWMVSIAMVVSAFAPAIPGYAAEERFGEGNQYVSETADAADSASLPDASDADRTVEEENATADSSSADVSSSEKESAIDTEQSAELLTAQGEHPTAGEADVNTADSVLKLRSIDIMYGESDDNSEGKLDKLFGVDMEGYKITYKIAELKDDKAAEDASEYELKLPEDKNAYELIEGVKLSEIAAGSKAAVYVMAEPATEDDLMTEEEQPSDSAEPVFGAVRISIIKRPVRIEIPASENICVYKPADEAKPEDTLVIKRDSEEYAGIRITPVTEYEIKDEEGNVTLTEGKMAAPAPALDVTDCIDGDITLDISDIDYETEGFADVPVAFSFASDYDRSFSYDGRSTASVTVYPYAAPTEADEAIDEDPAEDPELLGENKPGDMGFYINDGSEYVSFKPDAGYTSADIYLQMIKDSTGADVSGAPVISCGTKGSLHWDYPGASATLDQLKTYYRSNLASMEEFDDLAPGTYKLWAVFRGTDKTDKESETKLSLYIQEHDASEQWTVAPVTDTENPDGSIETTGLPGRFYDLRLEGNLGTQQHKSYSSGSVAFDELSAGKYRLVCYSESTPTAQRYLSDSYMRTVVTEPIVVPVKIPVSGIRMYSRSYSEYTLDSDENWDVPVGQVIEVGCTVSPANAYDTGYEYKSSDPKVASVDQQGNIKALKAGKAMIGVTSKGLNSIGNTVFTYFYVTVDPSIKYKKLKTMKFEGSIKPVELSPKEYDTHPVKLTVVLDKEFDGKVKWEVSDDSIAVWRPGGSATVETTASEGKTSAELVFNQPGQVTVTATAYRSGGSGEAYEPKQITTTVTVDGILFVGSDATGYYKNGHKLTGFLGFDEKLKLAATGSSALTSKKVAFACYADPSTGDFAKDIVHVGEKMYYCMPKILKGDTDNTTYDVEIGGKTYTICINKKGELRTGWVAISNKEYYFSPETGYKVGKGNRVPRGKGKTYILNDNGSLGCTGLNKIGSDWYVFDSNSIMLTGLVCFDASGAICKAANASYAQYFDPYTGAQVLDSVIKIGNKTYYNQTKEGLTQIPINLRYQGDDEKWHISDKTGAALKSQFVTYEGKTYYADESGCLLTDCYKVIKGKLYKFNLAGERTDTAGDALISTGYKVIEPGDEKRNVYLKQAKGSKPADGLVFYYFNGTEKVIASDLWIYDNADEPHKIYHTDRNGRPVTGVMTFGEGWDKAVYFFEPDTGHIATTAGIKSYNKKLYLCVTEDDMVVVKTVDLVHPEEGPFFSTDPVSKRCVFIKDTNGTLATGITSYMGNKFIFSDEGVLLDGRPTPDATYSVPVTYKGKTYLVDNSYIAEGRYIHTDKKGDVIVRNKTGIGESDYTWYAVNKDGTLKTGWVTKNKKRYYANGAMGLYNSNKPVKIGGKLYIFNNDSTDPYALTGWQAVDSGDEDFYVNDLSDVSSKSYPAGTYYFCLDSKTGAAYTGFKKINAPETYGNGTLKLDTAGLPVIGKIKKNVFFNTNESAFPYGALARKKDITVNGKFYRFGEDGVAKSDTEGMTTVHDSGGTYDAYLKKDGTIATGRTAVKVGGNTVYYYFDAKGRAEKDVVRKTGSKWYYYGPNGQMSFDPEVYDITDIVEGGSSSYTVTAIFNKDGSIKQFVKYVNNIAQVVRNAYLGVGTSAPDRTPVLLDKNGRIVTGYNDFKPDNETKSTKVFINSDGSSAESGTDSIVKSGSKYYVVNGAIVQTDTSKVYEVKEYSALPTAGRKDYDVLLEMYSGYVPVMVNADGSLSAGRAVYSGKQVQKTQYGVPMDFYSDFVRSGKNWYISKFTGISVVPGKAGTEEVGAYDLNSIVLKNCHVIVSWDASGNLISVRDKETGKPLNGVYSMEMLRHFKNGLPAGGKAKVMSVPVAQTVTFDKDTGAVLSW